MSSPEPTIHSFVLKVWLDDASEADGVEAWRGRISHVPGGESRAVRDFEAIRAFVESFLDRERPLGRGDRLRRWWRTRRGI